MNRYGVLRRLLIFLSTFFVLFMLVLPLFSILVNSFRNGFIFYINAINTEYVVSALKLSCLVVVITVIVNTVFGIAAAWCITRYDFFGKKMLITLADLPLSISPVIAGLSLILIYGRGGWMTPFINKINSMTGWDIKIVFAIPGVVLATIFVTIPLISRELISVLENVGTDEEEAAALMGVSGFRIFFRITLPHIKYALIYGILLCTARAMGEFGAVNAISKIRGKTFTLPLEIDALYMSGTADSIVCAYAVSSILVVGSVVILIIKNLVFVLKEKKYASGAEKHNEEIREDNCG